MTQDFMAEFAAAADWQALHDLTAQSYPQLTFFPIPAEYAGEKDALAISIPKQDTDDGAWQELQPLLQRLQAAYAVEIIDLQTGKTISL